MSKKANKQLKSVILEVLKEVASTKALKSESDYVFTDEKITTPLTTLPSFTSRQGIILIFSI